MATVKTVGPGKDFETLQDWEAFARLQNNGQIAECYSGANLGPLVMYAGWAHVGNLLDPHVIRVASGHGHKGKLPQNINDIAHIKVTGATSGIITDNQGRLVVEGLYIELGAASGFKKGVSHIEVTVRNCFFNKISGASGGTGVIEFFQNQNTPPFFGAGFIQNNIILISGGSIATAIWVQAHPTITISNVIDSNTIICKGGTSQWGIIVRRLTDKAGGNGGIAHTWYRNNVVLNCWTGAGGTDFSIAGAGFRIASNNASSDTTGNATGTNNLINQIDSNWFVSPTSDFNLKNNSPGIDSGANLGIFENYDALRIPRPQLNGWDIGALELVSITTISTSKIRNLTSLKKHLGHRI
jgi:hypothetical protein